MQEKDITRKKFERHNDVFADIVNVLLFGGKNIISEDLLCDVPKSNLLKIDEKFDYQDRVISKYWKTASLILHWWDLKIKQILINQCLFKLFAMTVLNTADSP